MDMLDHQDLMWKSEYFIKALTCGYGAGKTTLCIQRAIHLATECNLKRVMFIVDSLECSVNGIKNLLNKVNIKYKYDDEELIFTINKDNESHEIIIGIHSDNGLTSIENIDALVVDEASSIDEELFDYMLLQVEKTDSIDCEVFLTGTPLNLNWYYKICCGKHKYRYNVDVIYADTSSNTSINDYRLNVMFNGVSDMLLKVVKEGKFIEEVLK